MAQAKPISQKPAPQPRPAPTVAQGSTPKPAPVFTDYASI